MLRPVAHPDESVRARATRWLSEMDELAAELAGGHHVFLVWRIVESAAFVTEILLPALTDHRASEAGRAFVEQAWRRRLGLVRTAEIAATLDALRAAVRPALATLPDSPPRPEEPPAVDHSLGALNGQIHAAIGAHLRRHLAAVTELEWSAAELWWRVFKAELKGHAQVEDDSVVPRYEALGEPPTGGQAALFTAEHNGVRRLLGKLELQQQALRDAAEPRQAMIDGLDRYLMLRHLLEHHTLREQNILYPHLAARVAPATLTELREILLSGRPWDLLREVGDA